MIEFERQEKANVNLSNSTAITNCLTHIPQDIKLELVDGTLTLKAGSKVYVPNGFKADGTTQKFDVVTIESDLIIKETGNGQFMVTVQQTGTGTYTGLISTFFSSATQPSISVQYAYWYDTTNNVIKYTSNTGSTWTNINCSFPIGIVTVSSGTVTSIDQIFNGFGYIGSTVFALPGVKGLIPDGRNEDGSLKNIEHTIDRVLTIAFPGALKRWIFIIKKNNAGLGCPEEYFYVSETQPSVKSETQVWYKPSTNEMFYSNWQNTSTFKKEAGFCYLSLNYPTNTSISDFNPKTTFQAVDRNDSSWLSGLGMPGNKYINLTLGASGSSYTAPANGWFYFYCVNSATNGWIYGDVAGKYSDVNNAYNNTASVILILPVTVSDKVTITYKNTNPHIAKFIYAEGEQ